MFDVSNYASVEAMMTEFVTIARAGPPGKVRDRLIIMMHLERFRRLGLTWPQILAKVLE
jgi:hypothetical protein